MTESGKFVRRAAACGLVLTFHSTLFLPFISRNKQSTAKCLQLLSPLTRMRTRLSPSQTLISMIFPGGAQLSPWQPRRGLARGRQRSTGVSVLGIDLPWVRALGLLQTFQRCVSFPAEPPVNQLPLSLCLHDPLRAITVLHLTL